MSIDLKSYLTNWRDDLIKARDAKHLEALSLQDDARDIMRDILDLDIAIAALTPAPAPAEVEIPEGFTKWGGGKWTGSPDDWVLVIFHDERTPYRSKAGGLEPLWAGNKCPPNAQRIIAYRIIEVSPEPNQSFHGDTDAGLVSGNLTPAEIDDATAELFDRAGELDGLDAEFARGPDAVPLTADTPPTNPEADERAKALDWYSPENVAERNKFDPFRMFKREDA